MVYFLSNKEIAHAERIIIILFQGIFPALRALPSERLRENVVLHIQLLRYSVLTHPRFSVLFNPRYSVLHRASVRSP